MLQAKKAKPKAKKKTKASKNVSFDSKKKKATDSDEEGSDSDKKKQGEPAKAAVPDFVDVLENKGSVTIIFQSIFEKDWDFLGLRALLLALKNYARFFRILKTNRLYLTFCLV